MQSEMTVRLPAVEGGALPQWPVRGGSAQNEYLIVWNFRNTLISRISLYKLVIVDTTAAPTLYVVGQ